MPQHRAVAEAPAWRCRRSPVDGAGRAPICSPTGSAGAAVLVAGAPVPARASSCTRTGARRRSRGRPRAAALIVEDDYDGELRYDRQPVGALQALAPEHVVYGGTASKTLAPGLRLGWLVVPPRLLDADRRACARPRTCTSRRSIRSRSASCCARARTSATCAACARATALAATAWSRCSPSARRRSCPSGSQPGLGVLLELPDGGPTSARAHRRGGAPLARAVPAGAALPLRARAARRRRDRLRRPAGARLRGGPRPAACWRAALRSAIA